MQCASYQFIAFDTNPSFFGLLWDTMNISALPAVSVNNIEGTWRDSTRRGGFSPCFWSPLFSSSSVAAGDTREAWQKHLTVLYPCRLSCSGYWPGSWPSPVQFSSGPSLSHVRLFWDHGQQHVRLPCPSPTPGACSNSCPSSRLWHPKILCFVVPFSFHLPSFLASGSF